MNNIDMMMANSFWYTKYKFTGVNFHALVYFSRLLEVRILLLF